MKITYVASSSTAPQTATYYTLKAEAPPAGSASIADLSTDNYPPDRVPLTDPNGYNLPNPANQVIFKINGGSIVYTPVSNTVNWAYVVGDTQYHILFETSSFMIPNRTETVERDPTTKVTTVVLKDNGVFNMTQSYEGF
jgi:hypothetical protein